MSSRLRIADLGEPVGHGRTSIVYAYGSDSVLKVPHVNVPPDWPAFEAGLTQAVHAEGVAAPEVRDIVEIEDRVAVAYERIHGPSMWQLMLDDPASARAHVRDLAVIQRDLFGVGIPRGLPDLVDRLRRKISDASQLRDIERAEGASLCERLPRGAALLHGDLHPGNILISDSGPVIIDWFDAAVGHPVADIVRSSLLLQPRYGDVPSHLPGATRSMLEVVHDTYLEAFAEELGGPELAVWQAVVAAGRLAEHAEHDETGLLEIWAQRPGLTASTGTLSSGV